jgi:hypothetical protein
MKNPLLSSSRCRTAARSWLLATGLLAAASVTAQNFVRNPDFEEPLGPDNWTVVYAPVFGGGNNQPTNSGPFDFLFAGRSTHAHKDARPGTWDGEDRTGTNYWSKFGGHFAPNHNWMMHAYFKQIVKGLTPGASYRISAWMAFFTSNDGYLDKCKVYLEALGGPTRTSSKTTPFPSANVTNINNNPAGWWRYAVTNTASNVGEIEVRLHFNKFGTTGSWEWRNFNAFYDHVAVMPLSQSPPPPDDLAITVTNQTARIPHRTVTNGIVTITWTTVTNQIAIFTWRTALYNTYDIELTSDFVSWSKFATDLWAMGPTTTYTAPLVGSAIGPRVFRIVPHNYVTPSPSEFLPPYKIVSLTRSNEDLTLSWESVMNNSYRIQYTSDLFDPASWAFVKWSPKLDTNLYATGVTYTFKTNLVRLFSFDPAFDPNVPLFFRIFSGSYQP